MLDLKEKKDLATNPPPVGGQIGYFTIADSLGNELKGKIYDGWASSYDTLEGKVAEATALFKGLVPGLIK